jgi:hypothetical protein
MVAQPPQPRYMSVDEWRELEQQSEIKHEYIIYELGDDVELTSIDVHLPLAAIYEGTDVPAIVEVPKGEAQHILRFFSWKG